MKTRNFVLLLVLCFEINLAIRFHSALQEDKVLENLRIPDDAEPLFHEYFQENSKEPNYRVDRQDFKTKVSNFIQNSILPCQNWQIPGLAITVVTDSQILLQEGFGYTDLSTKNKVDANTIFGIGSCTKAFTSTLLAMLVDKNLTQFDQAVFQSQIPKFRMRDPYVTEKVSLRDMCSHRTGLPRHDLMWASGPKITREQLVDGIQYLDSNFEFRTNFEYNNLMWTTAGHFVENIVGTSWESAVAKNIFGPLQMTSTSTSVDQAIASGRYAFPYEISAVNGQATALPKDINKIIELVGPAGSINSNIKDMANWLQFHLNQGSFKGNQLVSALNLVQTYAPSMFLSSYFSMPRPIFPASMTMGAYGMGWFLGTYNGHPFLYHGGNTIGHSAANVFFPLDNIGISILTNMNGLGTPHFEIVYFVMDLILGYQPWLNINNTCNFPCSFVKCSQSETPSSAQEKKSVKEVKDISEYFGTYYHPSYGATTVFQGNNANLNITYNNFNGGLVTRGDDVFWMIATSPISVNSLTIPVQFTRNFQGIVDSLLIPLEPTLPPIPFVNKNYFAKTCGWPVFPHFFL